MKKSSLRDVVFYAVFALVGLYFTAPAHASHTGQCVIQKTKIDKTGKLILVSPAIVTTAPTKHATDAHPLHDIGPFMVTAEINGLLQLTSVGVGARIVGWSNHSYFIEQDKATCKV